MAGNSPSWFIGVTFNGWGPGSIMLSWYVGLSGSRGSGLSRSISIDDEAHRMRRYSPAHWFNVVVAVGSFLLRLNLYLPNGNIGRVLLDLIGHWHWSGEWRRKRMSLVVLRR